MKGGKLCKIRELGEKASWCSWVLVETDFFFFGRSLCKNSFGFHPSSVENVGSRVISISASKGHGKSKSSVNLQPNWAENVRR
ncbi:hypothetical protein NE237_014217 [Protea cynaroides]|uniref:Uncharacterized protein n=1 Tax=Protea cynaroides TaxID=273540 RepID=A0A9Q0JSY8_9MAGN|nr:hypothetical protein NE237_014217 [Protea cynaroides]